jgi:hypothetical protein
VIRKGVRGSYLAEPCPWTLFPLLFSNFFTWDRTHSPEVRGRRLSDLLSARCPIFLFCNLANSGYLNQIRPKILYPVTKCAELRVPRPSVLSKYRTDLRSTPACNFIYEHKKPTIILMPIFTKHNVPNRIIF